MRIPWSGARSSLSLPFSLPLFLHLFLLLIFVTLSLTLGGADGYTIEPTNTCGVEEGQMSFVINIPVTTENREKLHVDKDDLAQKAYVEKDGARCAASKAITEGSGANEMLKIYAPILECGSLEVKWRCTVA